MRLIDADKLSYVGNHIGDEYEDRFHDKQWIYRDTIDNAPTIEAEPIVRCKDCMKLNRLKRYTGFGEVLFVCENTKMAVYETDFCSYGKRREP